MTLASSPRIQLEPLVESHAAELYVVLSEVRLYDYLTEPPPASVEVLAGRYRRLESRCSADGSEQWLNWAVRRIADRQCMGTMQATIFPGKTASVGFVLGSAFWRQGLAHEAAVCMLDLLFAEFGVMTVFATADRENFRSAALLERLGFRRIAAAEYPHGKLDDLEDAFQLDRVE